MSIVNQLIITRLELFLHSESTGGNSLHGLIVVVKEFHAKKIGRRRDSC